MKLLNFFKNIVKSTTTIMVNDEIIVNGKKIDPKSKEGKRIKKDFREDMRNFDKEMRNLAKEMHNMFNK